MKTKTMKPTRIYTVRDAVLRGVPRHPPHVRDGLDVLAGHWGMR